jgi:hypothetical protein
MSARCGRCVTIMTNRLAYLEAISKGAYWPMEPPPRQCLPYLCRACQTMPHGSSVHCAPIAQMTIPSTTTNLGTTSSIQAPAALLEPEIQNLRRVSRPEPVSVDRLPPNKRKTVPPRRLLPTKRRLTYPSEDTKSGVPSTKTSVNMPAWTYSQPQESLSHTVL